MISKLYHFLGGITFAIILLTLVAVVAISGTFLESASGSHAFAAQFTYGHPLFYVLVTCFFINILFSALRRWPFQRRHIPFLITHLGLLMILSGMIAKSLFGLQGTMTIVEGTAEQQVRVADRIGLRVQSRAGPPTEWLLKHSLFGKAYLQPLNHESKDIAAQLMQHTPHASEELELWTKGNYAFVEGIPPVPLVDSPEEAASGYQIDHNGISYDFQAYRTDDAKQLIEKLYLNHVTVFVHDTWSHQLYDKCVLSELFRTVPFSGGDIWLSLSLGQHAQLNVDFKAWGCPLWEQMAISLDGPEALFNRNITSSLSGSLPIEITLQRKPLIALIRSSDGEERLVAFGPHGEIFQDCFQSGKLDSVYVLDDGYGGYALQCAIPDQSMDLRNRQAERLRQLGLQHLCCDQPSDDPLPPPFALLSETCRQLGDEDAFPRTCLQFLRHWDQVHGWSLTESSWLLPEVARVIDAIDWSSVPDEVRYSLSVTNQSVASLEELIRSGENFADFLKENGWPLEIPSELEGDAYGLLDLVQRQLFMANIQIRQMDEPLAEPDVDSLAKFCTYCRVYGLHLQQLPNAFLVEGAGLYLRSPITPKRVAMTPLKELEKNRPAIITRLSVDNRKEDVALSLDTSGFGLKWPVLAGQYLARFQYLPQEIPYRVRLREARKVSYPNSQQPFSYEADVIVTDLRTGELVETTLSMNRVHETSDGYRFYLSGISPPEAVMAKVRQVHLAVNRDPAKYWLTYLGAVVMTLGIILLGLRTPFTRREP